MKTSRYLDGTPGQVYVAQEEEQMATRTRTLRTFEFRVTRTVDCLVIVRAQSLTEATAKVDAGEGQIEYELERGDWKRIGEGVEEV